MRRRLYVLLFLPVSAALLGWPWPFKSECERIAELECKPTVFCDTRKDCEKKAAAHHELLDMCLQNIPPCEKAVSNWVRDCLALQVRMCIALKGKK